MDGEELLKRCSLKTDAQLFSGLQSLDADEAETLADVLAHLTTLDQRHAAERLADGSLFLYCTRKLGYSEAEAYLRIRVARAARDYPRILTMISARAINVSAVARVAPFLTSQNYRSLLGKAARRTREELDRLVAALDPQPERRPVIRTISTGFNTPPPKPQSDSLFEVSPTQVASIRPAESQTPPPIPDTARGNSPLTTAGRVLFNFVGSASLLARFKRAKELLAHKYPSGDPDGIFNDALEALLDRKDPWRRIARRDKRRRAATAKR